MCGDYVYPGLYEVTTDEYEYARGRTGKKWQAHIPRLYSFTESKKKIGGEMYFINWNKNENEDLEKTITEWNCFVY